MTRAGRAPPPTRRGGAGPMRGTPQRCDATEDMMERVRIVWSAFQRWARSLAPEQRARVVLPTWFTSPSGERWTARKMLRRCIEHCREHTRSIEQILADYRQRVAGGGHGGAGPPPAHRVWENGRGGGGGG